MGLVWAATSPAVEWPSMLPGMFVCLLFKWPITTGVSSGQKERLLCEEADPRDPNNLVYCGYCHNHYKKMVCVVWWDECVL